MSLDNVSSGEPPGGKNALKQGSRNFWGEGTSFLVVRDGDSEVDPRDAESVIPLRPSYVKVAPFPPLSISQHLAARARTLAPTKGEGRDVRGDVFAWYYQLVSNIPEGLYPLGTISRAELSPRIVRQSANSQSHITPPSPPAKSPFDEGSPWPHPVNQP
jgi:hypothetical protein